MSFLLGTRNGPQESLRIFVIVPVFSSKVPPSLLLLSRTLYLPESLDTVSQIAAAVSVLPETAATGAKAKLGESEGKIENVTRLELIRCDFA